MTNEHSKKVTAMSPRAAIGKAIIALAVSTLILAGTLGFVVVTSHNTTIKATLDAEGECGFTRTCGVVSASGLELILSVAPPLVPPNSTLSVSLTELNTLSTTNNVSSSSEWRLSQLTWACGRGYVPDGVELFKGYYTLDNLTSASPLPFWGAPECPVDELYPAPNTIAILGNITSYAFQPNSDNASFAASYYSYNVCNPPQCTVQTRSLAFGKFPPEDMLSGTDVYAGSMNNINGVNQLGSSAPSIYTLVAGDEWGALVLLHFSVT
jgi:hypothetical protein